MIGYLVDASALWRLLRDEEMREPWTPHIAAGTMKISEATRTEFLYSATSPAHRDDLIADLEAMCEVSAVPKKAWAWVEQAQYRLTQRGQHRSAGPVDLLICATAVHHGLTVLHVDNDFVAVAKVLSDVQQQDARQYR